MLISRGLVDILNERSTHVNHTARGVGIGFFLAVVLIFPFFHLDILLAYPWTFVAIFLIFIIGVLDNHYDASPNTKFFVIILATLFLYFDNIVIYDPGTFFGIPLSLGWIALPFTIFAVVGFTNGLNLIDGLDGLATTVSMIILGAFFALGYTNDDSFMILISGAFISALLGLTGIQLPFSWATAVH